MMILGNGGESGGGLGGSLQRILSRLSVKYRKVMSVGSSDEMARENAKQEQQDADGGRQIRPTHIP